MHMSCVCRMIRSSIPREVGNSGKTAALLPTRASSNAQRRYTAVMVMLEKTASILLLACNPTLPER